MSVNEQGRLIALVVTTPKVLPLDKGAVRLQDPIVGAVEYISDPQIAPGLGTALAPIDGALDHPNEAMSADVSKLKSAAKGPQLLYVRARDQNGNWGPLSAAWLRAPGE